MGLGGAGAGASGQSLFCVQCLVGLVEQQPPEAPAGYQPHVVLSPHADQQQRLGADINVAFGALKASESDAMASMRAGTGRGWVGLLVSPPSQPPLAPLGPREEERGVDNQGSSGWVGHPDPNDDEWHACTCREAVCLCSPLYVAGCHVPHIDTSTHQHTCVKSKLVSLERDSNTTTCVMCESGRDGLLYTANCQIQFLRARSAMRSPMRFSSVRCSWQLPVAPPAAACGATSSAHWSQQVSSQPPALRPVSSSPRPSHS